tara:strand:+ start:840 stop:4094 length:3255 start_codon:yes stop_codon:yes gene_type:complete
MANENIINLKMRINDDGSLQMVGGQAEKTSKKLDKTAKSAHSADRQLKGAAQASSNTTKNFSKMSQGISGGLVPAYATLAANIFAISAAFRFLQSAGDLRLMQQGQIAYASQTGVALDLLTKRVQAATDGQLSFTEAAQAVQLGRAAGLSSDQISGLANVAKNASIALGRDLTDSFNRLTRGAIKAEPELLDELGIIVRLETATEEYARRINKAAKDLTTFEKSQAVVNQVLEQGEDKFSNLGVEVNQLNKLAKAFDDLLNTIKSSLSGVAEFMAGAMSNNITALAGAFALLGTGIAKSLVPAAPSMAQAGQAAEAARSRFASSGAIGGKTGERIASGDYTMRDINQIERSMKSKNSQIINYNKMSRAEMKKTLAIMKADHQAAMAQMSTGVKGLYQKWKAELYLLQAEHGRILGSMKAAALMFTRTMSALLSAAGYIGILFTIVGLIKQWRDSQKDLDTRNFEEKQRATTDALQQQAAAIEEVNKNLKAQKGIIQGAAAASNVLANVSVKGMAGGILKGGKLQTEDIGVRGGYVEEGAEASGRGGKGFGLGRITDPQTKAQMLALADTFRTMSKNIDSTHPAYKQLVGDIATLEAAANYEAKEGGIAMFVEQEHQQVMQNATALIQDLSQNGFKPSVQVLMEMERATKQVTNSTEEFSKAATKMKSSQTPLMTIRTALTTSGQALEKISENVDHFVLKLEPGATLLGEQEASINRMLGAETVRAILDDKKLTNSQKLAKLNEELAAKAERIRLIEVASLTDKTKSQLALNAAMHGATPLQAAELQKQGKMQQNMDEINRINNEIKAAEEARIELSAEDLLQKQMTISLLQQENEITKDTLTARYQYAQVFKSSFESGMAGALNDLATGKEKSFGDAMAKMGKGIMEGMAKKASERAAKGISDLLFGDKELDPYRKGAEIIKQAHIDGINEGLTGGTFGGDAKGGKGKNTGKGLFDTILNQFTGGKGGGIFSMITSLFGFGAAGGVVRKYAGGTGPAGAQFVPGTGNRDSVPAMLTPGEIVIPKGKRVGGNYNTTVNVNMEGGGDVTTDDEAAAAFGQAIQIAVTEEIANQQRPGGLLSPFGGG